LRSSCFKDNFFDYIVSISTIEHIGLNNTLLYTADVTKNEHNPHSYLEAIKEFRRILKPGGKLFLTVPYGKHKNHIWFQVFNSFMVDELINTFGPKKAEEAIFQYEKQGWGLSTREKAKNATCFDINITKQYDWDFAAFSRAVLCLEMIK